MALTKAEQEAKAALEAKVAAQEEQIVILEAEKEQLLITLGEQHEKMNEVAAKAATPVSSASEIEVDGEKYEVVAGRFNYNGTEITLSQLLQDADLQKELVAIGSGVLKKKEIV